MKTFCLSQCSSSLSLHSFHAGSAACADGGEHVPPVHAIKFSIGDLPLIAQLLNLNVIQSCQTYEGSRYLYMLEQLLFLDSLSSVEPPTSKRKRMRNQHFWRDSEKLHKTERVYVKSADVQLAMEKGLLVTPCSELTKEQRTSVWTVCLTGFGVTELLNRKISPLGDLACLPHGEWFDCSLHQWQSPPPRPCTSKGFRIACEMHF